MDEQDSQKSGVFDNLEFGKHSWKEGGTTVWEKTVSEKTKRIRL